MMTIAATEWGHHVGASERDGPDGGGLVESLDAGAESYLVAGRGGRQTQWYAQPPVPEPGAPDGMSRKAAELLELTNQARAEAGLAPVEPHPRLSEAAMAHAVDQHWQRCSYVTLSHRRFDGSNAGTRIRRTGLSVSGWAENVACGYVTAEHVFAATMASPGHRDNLLGARYTHVGIAYLVNDDSEDYWAQVFAVVR